MVGYLEIPVAGKHGSVKLVVYPQSSKAKVFEEQEPQAGESQWQLVEGCTYTYEFVDEYGGCRYQFERENEIVRFHPNKIHHGSEGTLTTGIYVGNKMWRKFGSLRISFYFCTIIAINTLRL